MRRLLLSTAVVLALGGTALGVMFAGAEAQPAPPGMQAGPDGGPPEWRHGQMHRPEGRPGWMPHWLHARDEGHEWMHHNPMRMMGLFYPSDDRALSGPDVQKIAEAFLLWQGNRSWKVTSVAENADNTVSFAFAAPDGTVIARFAVDRKTGRFHRLG